MTTSSHTVQEAPAPSDAAVTLRGAPLVRLLVRRDGDAVAAAGVLARALGSVDVPVQAAATDSRDARTDRVATGDPDAVSVAVGPATGADLTIGVQEPAAATASAIVRELDATTPAYDLALAGVVAAGASPAVATPELLDAAREADAVERRPGVGLATDDVAAGLAGSTLFHAPFSGDPEAAAEALSDAGLSVDDPSLTALSESEARTLASLVALSATESPTPGRAAWTVEHALRPLTVDGPVPTVEGYADVLDVAATVDPGLALAHALGDCGLDATLGGDRDAPLETWRTVGADVHAAVDAAAPSRYDGVVVLDAGDAPPSLVARLARDWCAPEPVTVAVGDDAVGIATVGADGAPVASAAADADTVTTTEADAPTDDGPVTRADADPVTLADAVAAAVGGTVDAAFRRAVVRDVDSIDEAEIVEALRDGTGGSP